MRLKNRRFLKDSGLLLFANIIVTGLGVVRTPAMTWMLPKEQVGMIGVVASWIPFVHLFSFSGLDTASYHYVAKGEPWAFFVNVIHRLKWSLLSALALFCGGAYWAWKGEAALAWMFFITAFLFPATNGLTAVAGTLGAQERFTNLFWYRIFESLVDFVGFIPLLLSLWWINQVITFYAVNQAATAVMLILYSIWLWRLLHNAGIERTSLDDEKEMVRYGKHQTALNAISVVQNRSDALLVGTFFSLSTMADYSVASLIAEQLKRLWIVYLAIRYPHLVRYPQKRLAKRLLFEGTMVWMGFAFLGISLFYLAKWLIPAILPSSYGSSIPYIAWLFATFIGGVPGYFVEAYFRMQQDEKRQYIMRTVAAVVGVAIPALLISPMGINGVLAGRLLASLALSIIGLILVGRKGDIPVW